jgi:hypothetical protein
MATTLGDDTVKYLHRTAITPAERLANSSLPAAHQSREVLV